MAPLNKGDEGRFKYRYTCIAVGLWLALKLFTLSGISFGGTKGTALGVLVAVFIFAFFGALAVLTLFALMELAHSPHWFLKYPAIALLLYGAIKWFLGTGVALAPF